MDKKHENIDDDMSKTFISEVGQKSAVAGEDTISLEDVKEEINKIPDTQVDSVKEEKGEEQIKNQNPIQDNNSPKKRKPIVTVFLMLLCFALGAGATYYYFEVYNTKEESTSLKKNEKEKTEKQEELNPNGIFVKELIEDYDMNNRIELYDALYSQEELEMKSLDENYMRNLVAGKIKRNLGGLGFSGEDFKVAVTKLFGPNVTLENKTFSDNGSEKGACYAYNYNKEEDYYVFKEPEGCGGSNPFVNQKIVKALKKENTIEVHVAMAILDSISKKVYKNYIMNTDGTDSSEVLEGITTDTFDIDKDYSKLNQYKYTFNYDSDNDNYYLKRIELMK